MTSITELGETTKLGTLARDLPLLVNRVLNTFGSLLDIDFISVTSGTHYVMNIWADDWGFSKEEEVRLISESSARGEIARLHEWLHGYKLLDIHISCDNKHIRLLFEGNASIDINAEGLEEDALDIFRGGEFFVGISGGSIVEQDSSG